MGRIGAHGHGVAHAVKGEFKAIRSIYEQHGATACGSAWNVQGWQARVFTLRRS